MSSDVLSNGAERGALTEETLFVQVEKNKYRCTLCEKIVPKHHLSSHLHVHTGYKCNVCGKEYTRKSSLTKHMKTRDHVKRKLFQCELCDKSFTRKCTLDIHLQLHQLYQGVYVCKECGKEFSQEMHLLDHMTKFRHHPTDVSASSTTNQSESPVNNDVESSVSAKVLNLPYPNEMVSSSVCENDFPRTTVVSSLELPKVSLLPLPNALLAISTSGSELSRPYTFNKDAEVHKTSISAYPSELIGSSSAASDSDLLKITSYNHSDLLKLSSSLAPYTSFDTPSTSVAANNVYVTSASHARTQPSWTSGVNDKSYVEKMIYESSQTCELENSKDLGEPEGMPSNANKHLILPDNGNQVLLRPIAAGERLGEEKQLVYNDIQQHPKQPVAQEYTQILLKPIRDDATGVETNLIYNDVDHINKMSTFHESQLLLKPVSQADTAVDSPSVHRTLVYSGIPHVNSLTGIQDSPHMILIPISREQLTEAHLLDKRLVYGSAAPVTSYVDTTTTTESTPATATYQTSSSPSQEVNDEDAGDKQQILRNMLISNMMGSMQYTTTCQTLPGQTLVFDIGAAPNGQEPDSRMVTRDHKRFFSSLSAAESRGAVCPQTALEIDGQGQHSSYQENKQTSGERVVDAQGEDVGDDGHNNTASKDDDIQTGHPRTVDAPKIPQMKYLAHMKKLNIASLQREVSNASLGQSVESPIASKPTMMVEDSDKADGKDRVVEDVAGMQRIRNALTQQQATFIYDYVPHPRSIDDDGAKGLVVYVDQTPYIARPGLQQSSDTPATTELRLQAVEAAETNVDMTQVKLLPQFTDSDPERRDGVGTPNTESTYSSVHSYSEASLFNDTAPAGENAVVENGSTEENAVNEPETAVGEERIGRKRVKKGGSSSSKRSKSDSGYKTYKCSSCDRYFPCASALERHRLNKHPPHVVCHTCSICGKALYHPSHVYIHMRTHV